MDLASIEQELEKLKMQMADLGSRYEDGYPEIRKLKSQIAAVEQMRDQRLAEMKNRSSKNSSEANPTAAGDDSADVKTKPQLIQLQSQLQANEAEIKNREQVIADLKSKINDYQGRLNQEPVREQQLADLTRGYDESKAAYDDLQKKKNLLGDGDQHGTATTRRTLPNSRSAQHAHQTRLSRPLEVLFHRHRCGVGAGGNNGVGPRGRG